MKVMRVYRGRLQSHCPGLLGHNQVLPPVCMLRAQTWLHQQLCGAMCVGGLGLKSGEATFEITACRC